MRCFKCGYPLYTPMIIDTYQAKLKFAGKINLRNTLEYRDPWFPFEKNLRFRRTICYSNLVFKFGQSCYVCGTIYIKYPSSLINKRTDIPKTLQHIVNNKKVK